jgi:hypothetical protein
MSTPSPLFAVALLGALAIAGCAPVRPVSASTASPRPILYEWFDDGGPGDLHIRINLSNQKAYYTRNGRPVGWSYVAAGRPGNDTPTGDFEVSELTIDKQSNRYGWIENEFGETVNHDATPKDAVPAGGRYVPAPMPFWMRLTDYGIGMHAGHIPSPGYPASHGCIRLPKPLAPLVFENVRVGTTVFIHHGHPFEVNPNPPGRKRTDSPPFAPPSRWSPFGY